MCPSSISLTIALISGSLLCLCFSLMYFLSTLETVVFTLSWIYLKSSSISFLRILAKSDTSESSFMYHLTPFTILAAHSMIKFLRPYFWLRKVNINCSIVSKGSLVRLHFSSCLSLCSYISLMMSFSCFKVNILIFVLPINSPFLEMPTLNISRAFFRSISNSSFALASFSAFNGLVERTLSDLSFVNLTSFSSSLSFWISTSFTFSSRSWICDLYSSCSLNKIN